MATFPAALDCILTEGYGEELSDVNKYLGANTYVYNPKGTAVVSTETHAEFQVFLDWYINTTERGKNSFTINLPFFGVLRDWEVKFVTKPDISPSNKSVKVRDTTMHLEVLDNIVPPH